MNQKSSSSSRDTSTIPTWGTRGARTPGNCISEMSRLSNHLRFMRAIAKQYHGGCFAIFSRAKHRSVVTASSCSHAEFLGNTIARRFPEHSTSASERRPTKKSKSCFKTAPAIFKKFTFKSQVRNSRPARTTTPSSYASRRTKRPKTTKSTTQRKS